MPSSINSARLTEIEQAAQNGLTEAARVALADARSRAPKDTGKLRRSGRVIVDDVGATVRFTAPHAYLQHENLDYQHPDGGEPKYLENAVLDVDLGQILADAIERGVTDG
ncbi:HK97 gp10 family phage protein [Microbacterium sp.]|jgi:hypothetical protein|uniref:HK97 gp10 family phage protein n=1 Tax=Microbacterium sp. TaxID=51671 RepID=UPI0037CCB97A